MDFLSAEGAPMSLLDKIPGDARTAPSTATVATLGSGLDRPAVASSHPLKYYAEPLSMVVLLLASTGAMLACFKAQRDASELRRIRDRYRARFGATIADTAASAAGVHRLAGPQ